MSLPTIHILYALYPIEEKINALDFFLRHVWETKYPLDLTIIENEGPEDISHLITPAIRHIKRENVNYDFGAWAEAFDILKIPKGEYVLFVNDTVIGPIVKRGVDWVDTFLVMFKDKVSIVSSAINCFSHVPTISRHGTRCPLPTIQSMCFMINHLGWEFINEILDIPRKEKLGLGEIIVRCELGTSVVAFKHDYNISAQLMAYAGVDFRKGTVITDKDKFYHGDVSWPGGYFDMDPHPIESVFVKYTHKRFNLKILKDYMAWSDH